MSEVTLNTSIQSETSLDKELESSTNSEQVLASTSSPELILQSISVPITSISSLFVLEYLLASSLENYFLITEAGSYIVTENGERFIVYYG